jgi:hypothetical protein
MELQLMSYILFFSLTVSAIDNSKIPSYQILINAQLVCSNKPIEPYKFVRHDEKEPFNEIAPKVWGVIKDYKLSDRENHPRFKGNAKSFRLNYTKMGLLRCGEKFKELSPKGISTETLLVVYLAYKKEGFFDTSSDDPTEIQENVNIVDYTMVRDGPNDGPPLPGRSGLPCLVKLEEILHNENSINLDLLCKGESKKAREFTKKEIRRAIKLWKSNN